LPSHGDASLLGVDSWIEIFFAEGHEASPAGIGELRCFRFAQEPLQHLNPRAVA
jgi:hypothetical protein